MVFGEFRIQLTAPAETALRETVNEEDRRALWVSGLEYVHTRAAATADIVIRHDASLVSARTLTPPQDVFNGDPLRRMRLENRVQEARSDVYAVEHMEAEPRRQVDADIRAANAVAEA